MSEKQTLSVPRWMKILLVGSVAVNIAVLGLVAGLALRGPTGAARPGNLPTDGILGMQRAMPDAPRRAIRRDFYARRGELGDLRHKIGGLRKEVPELLIAEPFDADALRRNLVAQSRILADFSSEALELLVAGIENMSPEQRAEFAENLRNPPKPHRYIRRHD